MGSHRTLLILAAILGFTGVLAGTFAAHGLRGTLSADMLDRYETGVRYHMVHALAILCMAIISVRMTTDRVRASGLPSVAGWFFGVGVLLFSGSLYLYAITGQRWLGMITPFGGVSFLVGWACLFAIALRRI